MSSQEQSTLSDQKVVKGTETKGLAAFDEATNEAGDLREHWQYLLGSFQKMGSKALRERQNTLDRILRDEGATYNDYQDRLNAKPWALDPIPLVIDSQEWSSIEAGVRERAELLNLVLKDLYGPGSLLKHGVLPPELIFSHRGFLRSCHGVFMQGEQQLIQYAADMVRAPDGKMRVLSDRTQAPSGAGYALENRTVMSRVFPSLFRDSHAHRLSLYFQSLRHKLQGLNPNGGIPRVVLMTPGAFNETYFEQVYLANYLGYQVVQGSDLTVRDGYVWIKTLEGLNRIDVILRRVDDYYCDPVELKGDSQLGVPGLLEVIRAGRVAVVNPLGSGILENQGLLRYLPAVANHFFGRDLSVESVPTFWCGNPDDLQYTIEHLDSLIVKTTHRSPTSKVVYGGDLNSEELHELKHRIKSDPLHYVSQEYIAPSMTPVWETNKWAPRPTVLRSFAVAGESSYIVMPGGLTRVGVQSNLVEITSKRNALSKDTWVLASEPEKQISLIGAGETAEGASQNEAVDLPSRAVENLFWVGRYAERAESALRLLRTVFSALASNSANTQNHQFLLRAVTHLTSTYPGFVETTKNTEETNEELLSVVLDANRPGSVYDSLTAMLNAASQVKDFVSTDSQRILNDLRAEMGTLPSKLRRNLVLAPEEELNPLVTALRAFAGSTHGSMARGIGWNFLETGRRVERILQTTSLLRSLWVPAISYEDQYLALESVLLSLDSLITYRRRYQRQMDIVNGLDLLLMEPDNPRSIAFQLEELGKHLNSIPTPSSQVRLSPEEAFLLEASTNLRLADLGQLATINEVGFLRSDLDQMLSRIQHLIGELTNAVSDRYFDHSGGPQPLVDSKWEDQF